MAGSAALTTKIDERNDQQKLMPVWEIVLTFTFASGDTAEVKHALPINGILKKIICKPATCSGAVVTTTLAIDDNRDHEILNVAALAENTVYAYDVEEPVAGTIDIGILPNTDPLSAWTVEVVLRGV